MSVVRSALLTLLLLALTPPAWSEGTLRQILTNGPTAERINVVFLAEGYLQSQTNQFTADAIKVMNSILRTPPLDGYSNHFNGFSIFVPSNETGSDHPSRGVASDTYFNSSYDSYGRAWLITIPPNDHDPNYANGQGKVDALLQSLMPEYDLRVLIVNDAEYGGAGGEILVTSLAPSSLEVAVHELGHTFAGLGDEYDSANPAFPDTEEPNTTRETNRTQVKWRDWILPDTPVPTPETTSYSSVVGLFEGAHYHPTGWFRPKLDCKMNHLGVPFCEVCSEGLVKAVYERVRPIQTTSPPTNAIITLASTQTVTLGVDLLEPAGHKLNLQWLANGVPVPGATQDALTLPASALASGTNSVQVEVTDPTPAVRNDPAQLLTDRRTWLITAQLAPALSIERMPSGDQIALTITGSAGSSCRLQAATELPAREWADLLAFTLDGTTKTIFLDVTDLDPPTFFRVISD